VWTTNLLNPHKVPLSARRLRVENGDWEVDLEKREVPGDLQLQRARVNP